MTRTTPLRRMILHLRQILFTDALTFIVALPGSASAAVFYIARNVMQQMGGRITVQSEVGRGSTFKLHLPVWQNGACNKRQSEERDDGKTVVGRR